MTAWAARRVVVALDASAPSREAARAAAELARRLGAVEVAGLFVEDINVVRLGSLPLAREIRLPEGISVVVANLLDPGATLSAVSAFPNAANRDRVDAAIESVNAAVKDLAQKYQAPLMDWHGLENAVFGPNTNLHSTLKVGNVNLNHRGGDPGPPNSTPTNAFVSDGFHPNTIIQGILANVVLQALDSGYGAGLALFSEQEILSYALIPYGGSDTLLSQIGAYTNYVLLPRLPRITSINVAGTNVVLQFSTISNQLYVLESRDALTAGFWATVTNNVPGTGGVIAVTNCVSLNLSSRFYRVRQLP